jgi:hypothetical protein
LQLPSFTPQGDDASSYVPGDVEGIPSPTRSTDSDGRPGPPLNILVDRLPVMLCPLTRGVFLLPSGSAEAEALLSDNGPNGSLGPSLPAIDASVLLDGDHYIPSAATLLASHVTTFYCSGVSPCTICKPKKVLMDAFPLSYFLYV